MARSTIETSENHLRRRCEGELELDLLENYAEDVVLLTANSSLTGHQAIRTSASRLREQLPGARFEFLSKQVNGPYALLIWRATSCRYEAVAGADSFLVRDGRIVFQSVHYKLESN